MFFSILLVLVAKVFRHVRFSCQSFKCFWELLKRKGLDYLCLFFCSIFYRKCHRLLNISYQGNIQSNYYWLCYSITQYSKYFLNKYISYYIKVLIALIDFLTFCWNISFLYSFNNSILCHIETKWGNCIMPQREQLSSKLIALLRIIMYFVLGIHMCLLDLPDSS